MLFNGGVFDAPLLRERMIEVIRRWFSGDDADWRPQVLENERRDLAVARGTAYYGMVRRWLGRADRRRIGALVFYWRHDGRRSSFRGLHSAGRHSGGTIREWLTAIFICSSASRSSFRCLCPARNWSLGRARSRRSTPSKSARWPRFARSFNPARRPPRPIASPSINARLTEIGTLELWFSEAAGPRPPGGCNSTCPRRIRTDLTAQETAGEQAGIVNQTLLDASRNLIERTFSRSESGERVPPENLMKRLTETLEMPRAEVPPSLLRELWQALIDCESGRKQSPQHEARWLSLLGFALRPGYGMAVDDWQIAQPMAGRLAGVQQSDVAGRVVDPLAANRRRVFRAGQQRAFAGPPLGKSQRASGYRQRARTGVACGREHEAAGLWRMLSSLELLAVSEKIELGTMLLDMAPRERAVQCRAPRFWALGCVGARVPLYGPLNTVVPARSRASGLRN